MEISDLREFVVLAETGNFLEAADILYSSQSVLSKHIKRVEEELGVPLFDRSTRKVKISKFGELLLPYARQITELQEKYTTVLHSTLESDQDVLTLGSIPALAPYNVTEVFVSFKKTRPQSTFNVVQTISEDLKEMLRQKKCELAFIRFVEGVDEEDDDLVRIPYASDTLVAVIPTTHPLAKQKAIPLKTLANENFLMIGESSMLYRLAVWACQQSGFEPKVTYNDHRLENLIELVINGMGVSLLMKPLARYHANPKVAIVDISPTIATQVCLCHLKDVELSDAAKHFILCTESQKSKNVF
jgi:LysR family transcriptional regulator, transcription activator of glutamate synthase operon